MRITDDNEFNAYWNKIQGNTKVLKSVAEYIAHDWLPQKEMWSAMSYQNRTIFEESDTNMLLEAFVITYFKIKIILFIYLLCH